MPCATPSPHPHPTRSRLPPPLSRRSTVARGDWDARCQVTHNRAKTVIRPCRWNWDLANIAHGTESCSLVPTTKPESLGAVLLAQLRPSLFRIRLAYKP